MQDELRRLIQERADYYRLGVMVTAASIQGVTPPVKVGWAVMTGSAGWKTTLNRLSVAEEVKAALACSKLVRGFDVLQALQRSAPQIEIYVLTNHPNEAYRRKAGQLGARGFGGMQGIKDFLAGLVLLQIERDDIDALGRLGDFLQQATAKFGGAVEDGHSLGGEWKAAQLGQQGAFEKRRHRARKRSNPKNR